MKARQAGMQQRGSGTFPSFFLRLWTRLPIVQQMRKLLDLGAGSDCQCVSRPEAMLWPPPESPCFTPHLLTFLVEAKGLPEAEAGIRPCGLGSLIAEVGAGPPVAVVKIVVNQS